MLASERWSTAFNTTGLVFFTCGLPYLLFIVAATNSVIKMTSAVIYAVAMIYFWIVQTAYHVIKRADTTRELMRRVDHTTVFFMIAGTFSPCIIVYGDGLELAIVVFVLWVIAFAGAAFMIWWKEVPPAFSSIVSFSMAVVGIVAVVLIMVSIPAPGVIAFIMGVSLLIVGGVAYAIKKPSPIPGIFTFHEIYHGLSLPGIISLFFLVVQVLG